MTRDQALIEYLIRLGDNALILGQRLGEWCGHAHQLESDIALTNIALDNIGQCRLLLSEAGRIEGKNRTENDLAFFRDEKDFRNSLLVEQPNENFGHTILRQYFYDVFQFYLYSALKSSANEFLSGFAAKSLKEVSYHRKLSSDWILRLGDGTSESHLKMVEALEYLWPFTFELFEMNEIDALLMAENWVPDLLEIEKKWRNEVEAHLSEATLEIPDTMGYKATGSRKGHHTEYLGFLLAEMQAVPRSMPEAKW